MKTSGIKKSFAIFGFLFGFLFPVIALIIDSSVKDISILDLKLLHTENPILYIIDLAPFIISITAYLIGDFVYKREKDSQALLEKELEVSKKYASYSESLIKGDYEIVIDFGLEYTHLKDTLVALKENLRKNEINEKQQNWTSKGMSVFIEVLRSDTIDLKVLCERIISNLVEYLKANQGGIFIVENKESEVVLELLGAYAYNKNKFANKTILPGQGLVGQVYLEKETIFLKEIPEGYTTITSGLGESTPKNIIIQPLKINKEIVGVIELASFQDFLDHEINFIAQLSESIASSLISLKKNEETKQLLLESKLQEEQLRSQEEEMRQNMEELAATQEEILRKEKEYQKKIAELEKKLLSFQN